MSRFTPWPKTPRLDKLTWTITEKIDGTNGQIIVDDDGVWAYSRNRLLSPSNDNYGFAAFVEGHEELLQTLAPGTYVGEWAGPGIQKNPLKLEKRMFFLFEGNFKSYLDATDGHERFHTVPILAGNEPSLRALSHYISELKNRLREGGDTALEFFTYRRGHHYDFMKGLPEGFVLKIGSQRFKYTTKGDR